MKKDKRNKTAVVLGAGVAGLATAIRLAAQDIQVAVYEQHHTYGGKMGVLEKDGFRWDTGPSLFTKPQYVEELLALKKPYQGLFEYKQLSTVCNYFWNDGTRLSAPKDAEDLANTFELALGEPKENVLRFLAKSKEKYQITNHVFLEKSLHKLSTYLRFSTIKSMLKLGKVDIFKKMHRQNEQIFTTKKAVQFFDRYATYNGSNPYWAPATLNVIPHYEFGFGAYLPSQGIRSIATALYKKALQLGVTFYFNTPVAALKKTDQGYLVNNQTNFDIAVCNIDIATASKTILKDFLPPKRRKYNPSSSALIFYWGVNKILPDLDVHNILFADDYEAEFNDIFTHKTIHHDPTVYIHITSKEIQNDAPKDSENWFVMVNAPYLQGQNWNEIIANTKQRIFEKVKNTLAIDLTQHLVSEEVLTPQLIEQNTGSLGGSLYGSSSNDVMAAFLRKSNFSTKHKGLYFCGGSVHPGGGIPLCLLSAKIAAQIVQDDL